MFNFYKTLRLKALRNRMNNNKRDYEQIKVQIKDKDSLIRIFHIDFYLRQQFNFV